MPWKRAPSCATGPLCRWDDALSKIIFAYPRYLVKQQQHAAAFLPLQKSIPTGVPREHLEDMTTHFPRRGNKTAAVTLAVVVFVLLLLAVFLYLRHESQHQT